jgi:hypothetical protein
VHLTLLARAIDRGADGARRARECAVVRVCSLLDENRGSITHHNLDAAYRIDAAPRTIDVDEPDRDTFDRPYRVTGSRCELHADSLLEPRAQRHGTA